jgi:hypothetical protein
MFVHLQPSRAEITAATLNNKLSSNIAGCWNFGMVSQPISIEVEVNITPTGIDPESIKLIGGYAFSPTIISENLDAARRTILRCALQNLEVNQEVLVRLSFDPVSRQVTAHTQSTFTEQKLPIQNTILLTNPINREIEEVLTFYLNSSSISTPILYDEYERDPFGRGSTYDRYVKTFASCRLNLFLVNEGRYNIAFRDPFSTVIGLKFLLPDQEILMQGNVGMSTLFRGLSDGNVNILRIGDYAKIEFVSMSSTSFSSRLDAENWVSQEACNFNRTTRIEPYGIMGEIMMENESEWRNFNGSFKIVLEHFN